MNTERLLQLFKEYYMPKRNTYLSRGDFFWAQQEEKEIPEKTLEKTSIGKQTGKLIREKILNLKTTMD